MKLKVNREYALRHLFFTLVMAGLCCWFGYDGLVRYPAMPAAALYKAIEGSEAPTGYDLDGFKRQKTQTQYGFALLTGLAALVVGLRLLRACRFDFSFDDAGFTCGGVRRAYSEIRRIDRSQWAKKNIVVVDGIVLDAWHHVGVREFVEAHLPQG